MPKNWTKNDVFSGTWDTNYKKQAPNIFHCILAAGLNRHNYGQVSANFKQLLKASIPFESSWDIQTVLVGTLVASYQEVKVIRWKWIRTMIERPSWPAPNGHAKMQHYWMNTTNTSPTCIVAAVAGVVAVVIVVPLPVLVRVLLLVVVDAGKGIICTYNYIIWHILRQCIKIIKCIRMSDYIFLV